MSADCTQWPEMYSSKLNQNLIICVFGTTSTESQSAACGVYTEKGSVFSSVTLEQGCDVGHHKKLNLNLKLNPVVTYKGVSIH